MSIKERWEHVDVPRIPRPSIRETKHTTLYTNGEDALLLYDSENEDAWIQANTEDSHCTTDEVE